MGFQSNFKAYAYDGENRLHSIRHLNVETLKYFGREFIEEYKYPDTTEVAIEVFNYHDQCYTIDLIKKDIDKIIHSISFAFYDQSNKLIQEYIHDNYLAEGYEDPIERFYSYEPGKRLMKEILYDNVGKIQQVNSYIYE